MFFIRGPYLCGAFGIRNKLLPRIVLQPFGDCIANPGYSNGTTIISHAGFR
ncbi:MAG TPA: hypothetical protein QGF50_08335 [Roseibacillus sp.]|nr:hypothetical protein [Roseibacillus sp.]